VLYNSDINIIILDEASKDKTHGLPLIKELKIYKKNYLIKVPGVSLSVYVACEKGADNTHLATIIYEVSRIISPGLQIIRIRWLHN
jgi:hypothetical protein